MRKLEKGFLRGPLVELRPSILWVLLAYWLGSSFILYLFLVYLSEGLVLTITKVNWSKPIENTHEQWLFGILMSGLAAVSGLSVSLRLWIRNISVSSISFNEQRALRSIYNQVGFNFWNTFHFVTRFLFVLSTCFVIFFMNTDFFHFEGLEWLIYSFLLVFFLNTQLHFYKILKKNYFKALVVQFLIFLSIVFCQTLIRPFSHATLNESIKRESIVYRHDFALAEMKTGQSFQRRYSNRILITPESTANSTLNYYYLKYSQPVKVPENKIWDTIDTSWYDQTANLYLDRRINFSDVEKIKFNVFEKGIDVINIYTTNDGADTGYTPFGYSGLRYSRLFNNEACELQSQFLDSLKAAQVDPKKVLWPEQDPCYVSTYMKMNRILVEFDNSQIWVNGGSITEEKLKELTFNLFSRYKNNVAILLKPSPETNWGKYVELLDIVRSQILDLRIRDSGGNYSYDRYSYGYSSTDESVVYDYPFNIFVLSGVHLKLYNYLNSVD